MKRIAGIINLDHAPVHQIEIHRMLGALQLQPQDRQETWVNGDAGLGYISIGDASDNSQDCLCPVSDRFVIIFDGRIDNRRELAAVLRPQLGSGGVYLSDESIVLAAFDRWGFRCPQHLIGDFVFAIWDMKVHRLMCARDHLGVKPLYYSLSKGCFLFASSPDSLFASHKIPPVLNEDRIADLLMEFGGKGLEAVDKNSSFYENVYRLPPAHVLILEAGEMDLKQYWELSPSISSELRSEQDFLDAFQELFAESVRCRLLGLPKPASMLSGGMDSSAIVGVGRKFLSEQGRSLHAFAVISNQNPRNRETKHINSILCQGNLDIHLISETEISHRMDELLDAVENEAEPFDCLMNLNRAVYLHSKDQGVNVLLDGVDGDLLLSNSHCIPPLWRKGFFREAIHETLIADGVVGEYHLGTRYFIESLQTAFIPVWMHNFHRQYLHYLVIPGSIAGAVRGTIIDYEFAGNSHLEERLEILESYSSHPPSFSQIMAHQVDLNHPNLPAGLERYERVASALGIEPRHPLIDIRLVKFCLGLPWQFKTWNGWTKRILRLAMKHDLPTEVVWRRDKDSLMWETSRLVLRERTTHFHQATLDEKESLKPYVDIQKLEKIWQEYLIEGNEKHAMSLWSGIALAFWLRRHRNMVRDLKLEQ